MAAAAESISPATWVIRSIKADDDPFPESGLCDTTLMRSWESRWANDWPAARASQAPSIHDLLAIMQVRKAVQQSINVTDQYVSIHSYSESSVRSIDNTKSNYTDFPRRCLNIYVSSLVFHALVLSPEDSVNPHPVNVSYLTCYISVILI